jgi:hypothetical protein
MGVTNALLAHLPESRFVAQAVAAIQMYNSGRWTVTP